MKPITRDPTRLAEMRFFLYLYMMYDATKLAIAPKITSISPVYEMKYAFPMRAPRAKSASSAKSPTR